MPTSCSPSGGSVGLIYSQRGCRGFPLAKACLSLEVGDPELQALLLAAGKGTRLRTEDAVLPKCLVPLHGTSLLRQAMQRLTQAGVTRFVIVVGYQSERIIADLGDSLFGMPIDYVENPRFETTNNIVSVLAAERFLSKHDTILVETDVVFTQSLIDKVLVDPRPNLAVVDRFHSTMDGGAVEVDVSGRVLGFHDKTMAFSDRSSAKYLKTVNIYKLSREFAAAHFMPVLKRYVAEDRGHEQHFYEQALDRALRDGDARLEAFQVNGASWYEIDDAEDLSAAASLFTDPEDRYQDLASRGGGYWRFPGVVDLSNPAVDTWPDPSLLDEISWGVREAIAMRPSSAATQDILAAHVLHVKVTQAAVVPSWAIDGIAGLRRVGPDDLRAEGLSRLSELVDAQSSTAVLVPISRIYGLEGLDLNVIVSSDDSILAAARSRRSNQYDSVAEYALRAVGKLERRLFPNVIRLLNARDELVRSIESSAGIQVSHVDFFCIWCTLPSGRSLKSFAAKLLSEHDLFVAIDEATRTFRLSPWSAQKSAVEISDLVDVLRSGEP